MNVWRQAAQEIAKVFASYQATKFWFVTGSNLVAKWTTGREGSEWAWLRGVAVIEEPARTKGGQGRAALWDAAHLLVSQRAAGVQLHSPSLEWMDRLTLGLRWICCVALKTNEETRSCAFIVLEKGLTSSPRINRSAGRTYDV